MKRTTKVTIETERHIVIRSHGTPYRARCEECGAVVNLISVVEARTVVNVSSLAIHRWLDDGCLHFTEAPDGALFICLDSLMEWGLKTDRRSL